MFRCSPLSYKPSTVFCAVPAILFHAVPLPFSHKTGISPPSLKVLLSCLFSFLFARFKETPPRLFLLRLFRLRFRRFFLKVLAFSVFILATIFAAFVFTEVAAQRTVSAGITQNTTHYSTSDRSATSASFFVAYTALSMRFVYTLGRSRIRSLIEILYITPSLSSSIPTFPTFTLIPATTPLPTS